MYTNVRVYVYMCVCIIGINKITL